jgi:hypothetical protein
MLFFSHDIAEILLKVALNTITPINITDKVNNCQIVTCVFFSSSVICVQAIHIICLFNNETDLQKFLYETMLSYLKTYVYF